MRIIGPDELLFGVDSLDDCHAFLSDAGLEAEGWNKKGGRFVALDGTGLIIRHKDDPDLPPPLPTTSMLRMTVYGVEDEATIDEIRDELSKDREVITAEDGTITCYDDTGFLLKFQVTIRKPLDLDAEMINSPGAKPGRRVNEVGSDEDADVKLRTLSHIVYFVPDADLTERFYVDRLGFVVTDRLENVGPFMRPASIRDHHTMFLLKTPPHMLGIEHFAFHMKGPTELMLAGSRMVKKGYESYWGPGRHKLASNWFWYFNTPLGTHFEFDADMDIHDDEWEPRTLPRGPESSQMFLFENVEKWAPTGGKKH